MLILKLKSTEYKAELDSSGKPIVIANTTETKAVVASTKGKNALLEQAKIEGKFITEVEQEEMFVPIDVAKNLANELAKELTIDTEEVDKIVDYIIYQLDRGCVVERKEKTADTADTAKIPKVSK